MIVSRYELGSAESLPLLNRVLRQGWKPVREIPVAGAPGNTNVLVLLEKEAAAESFSGNEVAPGIPLSFLSDVMLLEDLSDEELRIVLNQCRLETTTPGHIIFEKDDPAVSLQIVLQGSVDVILPELPVRGQSVVQLQPGGVFGESSFFADAPHTMRAVAGASGATLLTLDRAAYDDLFLTCPAVVVKLTHNAARILAVRLQETDGWVWSLLAQSQQAQISASWRRYRHRVTGSDPTGGFFGV